MKRKVCALLIASMMVLTGCGSSEGVSQEEYDALKAQLEAVQAENTEAEENDDYIEQQEETTNTVEKQEGNSVTLKQTNETSSLEEEKKEIVLVNSWYSISKKSSYTHINYVVKIENPNENYDVIYPKIQIIARSADGSILSSDDMTLNSIAAGDTIMYGNDEQYEGDEPDSVEISVSSRADYCQIHDGSKYVNQEVFEFNNASEQGDSWKKITGEMKNNSDVDFSTVAITVLYSKDGSYVGGTTGYVSDVRAGGTSIFEVSGSSYIDDYDAIELYGLRW